MGCGNSKTNKTTPEVVVTKKTIVVLGATSDIGQAVVKALATRHEFTVVAVTRYPTTLRSDLLRHHGATVVRGNLDDVAGMLAIMQGAYGCFVVSSYWSSLSHQKEIKQGKDAIYCARQCGVRHFVYSGNEMASRVTGRHCGPMDGKAAIDEHLRAHTLPYLSSYNTNMKYTIIRVSFLFDNLLTLLKPHPLHNGTHAITLPMEGQPLAGISSEDVGRCVKDIFRFPTQFADRIIKLSADTNTVDNFATILSRHLWPKKFVNPNIRLVDFEGFGFQEARDLASVFHFYQLIGGQNNDVKSTRRLFPHVRSFEEWVIDEQRHLDDITDSAYDNEAMDNSV